MRNQPNRLLAICLATLTIVSIGGWQLLKFVNGHGFFSELGRYGWIPLVVFYGVSYLVIYRWVIKHGDS